jgi:hypothetical protein
MEGWSFEGNDNLERRKIIFREKSVPVPLSPTIISFGLP